MLQFMRPCCRAVWRASARVYGGEIHAFVEFPIARVCVPDLLQEISDRLTLMKVCAQGDTTGPTDSVRFATAINLDGGVTFAHIRNHLFEWLENVRHFGQKYRSAPTEEPPMEIQGRTVH
jgi:hypothetical protein